MTLWTPGGDDEPRADERHADPLAELSEEERGAYEEFLRARDQLRRTPVADLVANHAVGLWQLALIHLAVGPDEEAEPDLVSAQIAVDAMAALVEGMQGRLGAHEGPLTEALANVRMVFVEVSQRRAEGATPS